MTKMLQIVKEKKSVGRPRHTWMQENLKEAWSDISVEPFQATLAIPHLEELATRRTAPFNLLIERLAKTHRPSQP